MGGCAGKPIVEVQPVFQDDDRKTSTSMKIVVSAETGERQAEAQDEDDDDEGSRWDINNYELLSIIGKVKIAQH